MKAFSHRHKAKKNVDKNTVENGFFTLYKKLKKKNTNYSFQNTAKPLS